MQVLELFTLKESVMLYGILLVMGLLRAISLLVDSRKEELIHNIIIFLKHEIINFCVVTSCILLDKLVVLNYINLGINISFIFTLLVLIEQLYSILSDSNKTMSSMFIIQTLDKIKSIIDHKNYSK
ncbi:hypothetical protein [Lactiplantibacillus plantarum]|uniref:hypothetical protein n=1 Tax=Lactiplantibacillus plantarum TaxID=1590 RepID=UPI0020014258|nr:hypothetical protein [Lactiplantibacillus plantarum]